MPIIIYKPSVRRLLCNSQQLCCRSQTWCLPSVFQLEAMLLYMGTSEQIQACMLSSLIVAACHPIL